MEVWQWPWQSPGHNKMFGGDQADGGDPDVMSSELDRDLDKRLYDIAGRKLYEARRALPGPATDLDSVVLMLDALDNLYALLSSVVMHEGSER